MKTLLHPLFLICFALWSANQILELNNIYIKPLYSYLDDLLCFPLILTFILAVQRNYFNDKNITIPASHVVLAVAAFTLCFELVLPFFRAKFTADIIDVFAYSTGALAFYVFINRPLASAPAK